MTESGTLAVCVVGVLAAMIASIPVALKVFHRARPDIGEPMALAVALCAGLAVAVVAGAVTGATLYHQIH